MSHTREVGATPQIDDVSRGRVRVRVRVIVRVRVRVIVRVRVRVRVKPNLHSASTPTAGVRWNGPSTAIMILWSACVSGKKKGRTLKSMRVRVRVREQ